MSFINCKKCGKAYSDKAPQCPFCNSSPRKNSPGKPRSKVKSELKKPVTPATIILFLLVAGCWFGYMAYADYQEKEERAKAQIIAAEKRAEEAARRLRQQQREQRIAERKAQRAAEQAAMTPQERREEQIRKGFSPWDGSHIQLTRAIKKIMNDPESFDHAETKYIDKGDHLLVTESFRGTNKFGGVVKNWVRAKCTLDGKVIEIIDQGP